MRGIRWPARVEEVSIVASRRRRRPRRASGRAAARAASVRQFLRAAQNRRVTGRGAAWPTSGKMGRKKQWSPMTRR